MYSYISTNRLDKRKTGTSFSNGVNSAQTEWAFALPAPQWLQASFPTIATKVKALNQRTRAVILIGRQGDIVPKDDIGDFSK